MTPHTNELLNVTGQNAAVDGNWFQVTNDGRTNRSVVVSIAAGTATVVLEGRNGPHDTPAQINSVSASGGFQAAHFPQMRARLTAAAGAAVVVSVDGTLRQVA